MKIAYTGLGLPEGKVKYNDPIVIALTEKFAPAKVSPYFFEFMPDAYSTADAIVIKRAQLLDLLILDIDKLETRLERTADDNEKAAIRKCLAALETETPICDVDLSDSEAALVTALAPLSLKPTLILDEAPADINALCVAIMLKSNTMFFYTAGKQEVHAWFVDKGVDAVTCAGKIHTDLARGFIKAEIVNFDQLMQAHSIPDARSKGLTRLVDKDYIIEENTILEIRFNV